MPPVPPTNPDPLRFIPKSQASFEALGKALAELIDSGAANLPDWLIASATKLVPLADESALEDLIWGVGQPEVPAPGPSAPNEGTLPSDAGNDKEQKAGAVAGALAGLAAALASSRSAVDEVLKLAELERGREYKHALLPRLVSELLYEIYGDQRNPGHVIDEAIDQRFTWTSVSERSFDAWQGVLKRASTRFRSCPASMALLAVVFFGVYRTVDSVLASNTVTLVIGGMPVLDEREQARLGFHLGGIIGWLILWPLSHQFSEENYDDLIEEIGDRAGEWSEMALRPSQALPPVPQTMSLEERPRYLRGLELLRGIGWTRSADFVAQIGFLSGDWLWSENSEVHRRIRENIRQGAHLHRWQEGGRLGVSPLESSILTVAWWHLSADDKGAAYSPWDEAVSLSALVDDVHSGTTLGEGSIPDSEKVYYAIEDAHAAQQFELTEALASLWLLQCSLYPDYEGQRPISNHEYLLSLRSMLPRDFRFVGPMANYLRQYFESEEFEGAAAIPASELSQLCAAYGGPNRGQVSSQPKDVTYSVAAAKLTTTLVGESYLQIPENPKRALTEAIQKIEITRWHERAGLPPFEHFGGDVMALTGVVEALIRDRLNCLSDACLAEMRQSGFRWPEEKGLGAAHALFKQFQNKLSLGAQSELKVAIPALPLAKYYVECVFRISKLRNKAAHGEPSSREDWKEVQQILFRQEGSRDRPGLIALIANQVVH